MNGIKMSDCKFYVNEAERTVVCVIPKEIERDGYAADTDDMLLDFIGANFSFTDIDIGEAIFMDRKSYRMPKSFMGKAVCAKEDEWDEELGKMIAFSRAKDKCYRSFFKRANTLVNVIDRRLNEMMTMFNEMGDKLNDRREKLEHMIEERTQK
jgi:hypothetical protein